ncbi:MAG: cytochrome c [Deltaproteobacteria bacterium]|nr:cytochrome c [Deltaproteobacteria bacterium]
MLLAAACAPGAVVDVPAQERGRALFQSAELSDSAFNVFARATCHRADGERDTARILPGADLAGVTRRARTWGGAERDLLAAVNTCLVYFMRGQPWRREDERARQLYEFLASREGGAAQTLPMTLPRDAADVPRGDPGRGATVYDAACRACHGAPHTGEGRATRLAPLLPGVADDYAVIFPGVPRALVFVEKVRHGQFYGVGGNMPFFSLEALSDDDLGALLAFLGV